jgi:hypothetical protein
MYRIIDTDYLVEDYVKTGEDSVDIKPIRYDGEYGAEVGKTKKEAYNTMCGMLSIDGPRTFTAINDELSCVTASLY